VKCSSLEWQAVVSKYMEIGAVFLPVPNWIGDVIECASEQTMPHPNSVLAISEVVLVATSSEES